jgi:hypothetical protein
MGLTECQNSSKCYAIDGLPHIGSEFGLAFPLSSNRVARIDSTGHWIRDVLKTG